jgi:hypothetical protein
VVRVAFSEAADPPTWAEGCIGIGNAYALNWTFGRIAFMNANGRRLTKTGT